VCKVQANSSGSQASSIFLQEDSSELSPQSFSPSHKKLRSTHLPLVQVKVRGSQVAAVGRDICNE
jgi:hypothetical protein